MTTLLVTIMCLYCTGVGFVWGAGWMASKPRSASGRDARHDIAAAAERRDIDRLARTHRR